MSQLILLCAATGFESGACQRAIRSEGLENQFEVLRTGVGKKQARLKLRERLKDPLKKKPTLIISSGFAGGRNAQFEVGRWILGTQVIAEGGEDFECDSQLSEIIKRSGLSISLGRVFSIDFIAGEEPLTRASEAVDMESYALAEVAFHYKIPFIILRMVSDTPQYPIPDVIRYSSMIFVESQSWSKRLNWLNLSLKSLIKNPDEMIQFSSRSSKLLKQFGRELRLIGKLLAV